MSKTFLKDIENKQQENQNEQTTEKSDNTDQNNNETISQYKKDNQSQIIIHVSEIEQLLNAGKSRNDILLHASEKQWNKCEGTIDTYIAKARNNIEKTKKAFLALDYGFHIRERLELLQSAKENRKYSDALKILDSIASLQGVVPKQSSSLDQTLSKIALTMAELTGLEISELDIKQLLDDKDGKPLHRTIEGQFEVIPEK
jgi:hypothetical protein